MPSDSVTDSFKPNHYGSYDQYGNFYLYTLTSVGPGASGVTDFTGIVAYATFNAAAIENEAARYQSAGWVVHVDLNYQITSTDPYAHKVTLNAGYYDRIGYQNTVEGDQTNQSGPGNGQNAYVYDDLTGAGETIVFSRDTNFPGVGAFGSGTDTASYSSDISAAIEAAAAAGRDLVLTLNEHTTGDSDGFNGGSIVLTATRGANPPTIAGTQAGQPVVAGGSDLPFSTVTLGDSANPGGAGDDVTITILDANGNATGALGVLTGAGLTSYGGGSYQLGPVQSLSALQTQLDALVFTASGTAAGSTATLEIDLQSASGSAADDQTTSIVIEAACFAAGTLIATTDGEAAVESIRAGDLVSTTDGPRPVIWTGRRGVDVAASRDPEAALLVRIMAGAFEDGVPRRDLLVTQEHCLLRQGVLVPARMLVNHRSIVLDRATLRYHYHHVELERHGILFAEGLPTESYLDTGNRGAFEGPVQDLHPRLAMPSPRDWTRAAAPLAVDRETVEPIWQALVARADRLGLGSPMEARAPEGGTDNDPELRLLLGDGRVLHPATRVGGCHGFVVPPLASAVRLLSRSARPSDSIGPFVDDRRRLGVAVEKLVVWRGLDDTVIPARSIALRGWHAPEGTLRWTDGAAELDLPAAAAPTVLDVHVAATMCTAGTGPAPRMNKAA